MSKEVATVETINAELVPDTESEVAIDFRSTLKTALQALNNQLALASSGVEKHVTLRDLEIAKHKTAAVLDAFGKVVQLSHLQELVVNDSNRFKRDAEMRVLRPLLEGLEKAANVAKMTLTSIERQIQRELEVENEGGICDIERVNVLQESYSLALENLSKTVSTTQKTIKLERESGGREYERIGKALPISYLANLDAPQLPAGGPIGQLVEEASPAENAEPELDENGQPKKALRKLSPAMMRALVMNDVNEVTPKEQDPNGAKQIVTDEEDMASNVPFFKFAPVVETPVPGVSPAQPIAAPSVASGFGFGAPRAAGIAGVSGIPADPWTGNEFVEPDAALEVVNPEMMNLDD